MGNSRRIFNERTHTEDTEDTKKPRKKGIYRSFFSVVSVTLCVRIS